MPTQKLTTGIDLYYAELHGAGEPVIFIPGTGFSGNVWEPFQVPALSKALQVVIMDPRGCGRSSAPTGVYSIEQMSCDVAALMDQLGLAVCAYRRPFDGRPDRHRRWHCPFRGVSAA